MTDTKNHGMTGNFHSVVINELNEARAQEQLSKVQESERERILNTPQALMVKELAKPGADIVSSLTIEKFTKLVNACSLMINTGNVLDSVKKEVVYNKAGTSETDFDVPPDLANAFNTLTDRQAHLLHMAVGVAGEATELLNAICQNVVLGKELDVENVTEEGGDMTFYIQGILNEMLLSFADIMLHNRVKLLGKRFPNGYSDKAAQDRADKA